MNADGLGSRIDQSRRVLHLRNKNAKMFGNKNSMHKNLLRMCLSKDKNRGDAASDAASGDWDEAALSGERRSDAGLGPLAAADFPSASSPLACEASGDPAPSA